MADIDNRTLNSTLAINGTDDDDLIYNEEDDVTIDAGAGNDTIRNNAAYNSINAGAGDDSMYGYSYGSTIVPGAGADTIAFKGDSHVYQLSSTSGNNLIRNYSMFDTLQIVEGTLATHYATGEDYVISLEGAGLGDATIKGGANTPIRIKSDNAVRVLNYDVVNLERGKTVSGTDGDDRIYNFSFHVSIDAGDGDDYIDNDGNNVTINAGDGNDSIDNNLGWYATINAGNGDDFIYGDSGHWATIDTGAGDDTVSVKGDDKVYLMSPDYGNNLIVGYSMDDTLQIVEGTLATHYAVGDDYVVSLKGADSVGDATIKGGVAVPIQVKSGDDVSVLNFDTVNFEDEITINGTDGDDRIYNYGDNVTIKAGEGNDSIYNDGWGATINAGDGNDYIVGFSYYSTIDAGAGDNTIDVGGDEKLYLMSATGGSNLVYNYLFSDVLQIVDGTLATHYAVGDDYVVSLKGADSVGDVTIKGGVATPIQLESDDDISVLNFDILNLDSDTTVRGTSGDDRIYNDGRSVLIDGGAGDDLIRNNGESSDVTIRGGAGNDTIFIDDDSYAEVIQFGVSYGIDLIHNLGADDTIALINGSIVTRYFEGDTYVLEVEDFARILLEDSADSINVVDADGNLQIIDIHEKDTVAADHNIANFDDDTVVNGTDVRDRIYNEGNCVWVNAGAGDDSIFGISSNVTVDVGAGNDTVKIWGSDRVYRMSSDYGNNLIRNYSMDDTLQIVEGTLATHYAVGEDYVVSLKGADSVSDVTIKGGMSIPIQVKSGDDVSILNFDVVNFDSNTTVSGTDGADRIYNYGDNVTINAGAGDDSIHNNGSYASINAGAGDDYINGYGYLSTIDAGAGNDTIDAWINPKLYRVSATGGNDLIYNYLARDTLQIVEGTLATHYAVGDDYVVSLKGADSVGDATIKGGVAVPIQVKSGDDVSVLNFDTVNFEDEITINGTDGADRIYNNGWDVLIDGGAGDDSIYNYGDNVTIKAGEGDDSIKNNSMYATINAGAGNDTVFASSYAEVIQFGAGDGTDLIRNLGADDTIALTDGSITAHYFDGNAYVLEVGGSARMVLEDSADLFNVVDADGNLQIFELDSKDPDDFNIADFQLDAIFDLSQIVENKFASMKEPGFDIFAQLTNPPKKNRG